MTMYGEALSETLSPNLVDSDEITETPTMRHIRSFTADKSLCGTSRDPSIPTRWRRSQECVVCEGLWAGMSEDERDTLRAFWGR